MFKALSWEVFLLKQKYKFAGFTLCDIDDAR